MKAQLRINQPDSKGEGTGSPSNREALVQMRGITKRFPGVVANDGIDLDLYPGEIHSLLGENGAGKTTLLNILSGIHQPDEGTISVRSEVVHFKSPHDALEHGIGTVYQHFALVPNLSVAENVILGLNTKWILDLKGAERRIQRTMEKFGLTIDPHLQVQYLSLGQQQRVEIVKVLFREPKILLLDEPTSVLTPSEVGELFRMVKQLRAEGVGVVFITHKLHEVLELSDRITILRNGQRIGAVTPEELANQTHEEISNHIVQLMFGGVPEEETEGTYAPRVSEEIVLTLESITILDPQGVAAVRNLSLELRAGEILGIAGVGGSGQKELLEAIAGQLPVAQGDIRLGERLGEIDLTNKGVPFAMKMGIAYITDDRIGEGIITDLSVAENSVIRRIDKRPMSRWMLLRWQAIFDFANSLIGAFDIKVSSPQILAGTLSGGNIQKLLLARELSADPTVLMCNQPTHGLDVKTAQFVWKTLREQASMGAAILLISSDLDELLKLSNRVGVMYNGELLEVLSIEAADRETVGRLMLGERS